MELDRSLWQGRDDAQEGERALYWHQLVQPLRADQAPGVALLGFACDAGVARNHGRAGAAEGPTAIRRAAARLAWHGGAGPPLIDAGDVHCPGDGLEAAQHELARRTAALLRAGHLPLLLGGGHEIAWGSFQGLSEAFPGGLDGYGVLNFDAHFDLRRPGAAGLGSSGTPFFQISEALAARGRPFRYLCVGVSPASNTRALFDTALERGVEWLEDELLTWPRLDEVVEVIDRFLARVSLLQLSICLDVLPGDAAPGVSSPAARGVEVGLFFALLGHVLDRALATRPARRLALMEIAECNPRCDPDGRTARIAARIAWECVRRGGSK